jgi:hypothetical protein
MSRAWVSGVAMLLLGSACGDFSIDPNEIAAIEFPPFPSPSIIEGDTLRAEDQTLHPLVVKVIAASGSVIPDQPVSFFIADTLTEISANGQYLLADSLLDHSGASPLTSRVVASVGSLQSQPHVITIVPRPTAFDLVAPSFVQDTILYSLPAAAGDTSSALRVQVLSISADSPPDTTPVPSYLVRYSLEDTDGQPVVATDTTQAFFLVADDGKVTPLDTTDTSGRASRKLRFRIRQGQAAVDTIHVLAQVRVVKQTFPALRWVVIVRPRT